MTAAARFADAVRRAAEGTPYVVTDETADGFTLHIDVADAQWWERWRRAGLKKCFSHTVVVAEAGGTYQVTERAWEVSWEGGPGGAGPRPVLHATGELTRGTVVQKSFQVRWARNDRGDWEKVVDHSFDSRQGRSLIAAAAGELGLRKRLDPSTRLGLVIAAGGVGLALAVLVVLGVLWLNGSLG